MARFSLKRWSESREELKHSMMQRYSTGLKKPPKWVGKASQLDYKSLPIGLENHPIGLSLKTHFNNKGGKVTQIGLNWCKDFPARIMLQGFFCKDFSASIFQCRILLEGFHNAGFCWKDFSMSDFARRILQRSILLKECIMAKHSFLSKYFNSSENISDIPISVKIFQTFQFRPKYSKYVVQFGRKYSNLNRNISNIPMWTKIFQRLQFEQKYFNMNENIPIWLKIF